MTNIVFTNSNNNQIQLCCNNNIKTTGISPHCTIVPSFSPTRTPTVTPTITPSPSVTNI